MVQVHTFNVDQARKVSFTCSCIEFEVRTSSLAHMTAENACYMCENITPTALQCLKYGENVCMSYYYEIASTLTHLDNSGSNRNFIIKICFIIFTQVASH